MVQICSLLNDHFCNIGGNLAARIDSDRNIHKFGTLNNQQNSLYLNPTTINEVLIQINKLNINKACGPDNIPASFVKLHYQFFANLIATVFNEAIVTGQYPNCLKQARVVPIFKSGIKDDVNNYRPISCLSVLDKLLEKLLAARLVEFTQRFNLICDHQYGFRSGSSTLTACCDLVDDIYDAIDHKRLAGALFIDLKKAFDTIDHPLLMEKMESLGIRGNAKLLFQSYLSNRTQFVAIGGYRSLPSPITTGVPQGSILGPILFLLFINDLSKLQLKGKLRLFADDTSISYRGVSVEDLQLQIKEDVILLQEYFKANLLSLNMAKTKYMIFHSPWKRLPPYNALEVHGFEIEKVSDYSFLGLTLDSTMKWTAHINKLKSKLSSISGVMWKISSFVPRTWLMKLYFSLFHSRLQYLVAIWGMANDSELRELQTIQNRCLKTVFGKPPLHPTIDLYKEAKDSILPIKALCEQQILILVRKILTENSIHHNILLLRTQRLRASRQEGHLALSRPNSTYGKKKTVYAGSKIYNDLPLACKNAVGPYIFKSLLRKHLKEHLPRYLPALSRLMSSAY